MMSSHATFQFFLAWASLFLGLRLLYREFSPELAGGGAGWGIGRKRQELQHVGTQLQEMEETLAAGMVPAAKQWEAIQRLSAPWGMLAFESLSELRTSGGALLPTLRRLRALVVEQLRALGEARARSSQGMAQAAGCALLIPVFGAVLYSLLPGVGEFPWTWGILCGLALSLSGVGSLWLLSMIERARWAGLPASERCWILASQCAGERFLALVRSGTPADLSWVKAMELLAKEAPGLAHLWGASVWRSAPRSGSASAAMASSQASALLVEAGEHLRKAVQLSLMEGRPCTERVEAALSGLARDLRSKIEAELSLLSTRALKPLFICVAPAVFLLLGAGLFLCFKAISEGGM